MRRTLYSRLASGGLASCLPTLVPNASLSARTKTKPCARLSEIAAASNVYLLAQTLMRDTLKHLSHRMRRRENTIISLPTGAGKTLIAVHAVAASRARHQSSSATAALFLVPTRSLVEQQVGLEALL